MQWKSSALIMFSCISLQPGMFSPGQQAPPPYPGQPGQPSHLQPMTPMFVAPPPKTQRVLHSEAYLKYIEGLNAETDTVSKWDQSLKGIFLLTNLLFFCTAFAFLSMHLSYSILNELQQFPSHCTTMFSNFLLNSCPLRCQLLLNFLDCSVFGCVL